MSVLYTMFHYDDCMNKNSHYMSRSGVEVVKMTNFYNNHNVITNEVYSTCTLQLQKCTSVYIFFKNLTFCNFHWLFFATV